MQSITIREVHSSDAEQVLDFLNKIGGESDNLTYGKEGRQITVETEMRYLLSVADDPHSVSLCAFDGERMVGNGTLSGMPRRMSHRAELGLSVLKEYWNQGIGGRLMEALIAYAGEHGIELISLDVRSDNASAIHLYEKYGFRKIGRFPAHIKIGHRYYDFDIMILDLREQR